MNLNFKLILALGCNFAFQSYAATAEKAKKPNVLFIMSDQHSARALGCYGNSEVKTPNLDKLAAHGVTFQNAFCQTGQCVPSRYSIWTGRYARSTGTYGNGNAQNSAENTVADLFKKAGYYTGTIGKHHMIMNKENQNHGFDLVLNPGDNAKPVNPLPYEEVHPGRSAVGESPLPNEKHTCGLITSEAIRFIRDNKERPFVLWCSFPGPHTPITPSAPWSRQYDPKSLTLPPNHLSVDTLMPGNNGLITKSGKYSDDFLHNQTLAYYYGLITQIDYNIGLLLAELDKLGLTGNTIVVYTADHGEMMSEHKAWTKGMTGYDATIRVPLILQYPGKFSNGSRVDELVCSIDLLPTLLDLSGLEIPVNIQGKSFLMLKNGTAGWRDYAISEIGSSAQNSTIAVRGKTEKYVLFRKGGRVEYEQLFDLKKDPWETKNLANDPDYYKELKKMRSELTAWEKGTEITEPVKSLVKVEE